MPATLVLGLQWGDEGKGKIVDLLSRDADFVVRSQGGANSGHTVVVGDQTFKLHCVPSGILREGVMCVIGRGMVVDPFQLRGEIEELQARGIDTVGRLFISPRTHLVLPHHKHLDTARESVAGAAKIGTTGRGIGPCYAEKANRTGIQIGELFHPDLLEARLRAAVEPANRRLEHLYGIEAPSVQEVLDDLLAVADFYHPFVGETSSRLLQAYDRGERLLFEGAQAVMLDIDAGTYPYVTSSNTGVAGVSTGAGFPSRSIERVIGVSKAYCTRVGLGPFPSEADPATAKILRDRGDEYGTTTRRPRRTGWIDLAALRSVIRSHLVSEIHLTKLDVMDTLPKVKLCVGYEHDGKVYDEMPEDPVLYRELRPIYEEMPGWCSSIAGLTDWDALPKAAQMFIQRIATGARAPVTLISTGPKRSQNIEAHVNPAT